jgi:N-acetylneuraminic acid mutarotase/DNA-binding transcriptional ArsR family regulator
MMSKMDVENVEEDRKRAEVFDALSHPTRIMLLKALSDEPLGFADLKKKLGIESSGHLQHHISKLGGLIKTDDYGKYTLSDQGKDALHSVDTVESVARVKASENEQLRVSRKNTILKSTVIILAVLLALSLAMTAFQYSNALSLQSKIDHLNEVIVDRDTLITQLARAINAIEPSVPSEGSWVAKAQMGLAKTGFGVGVVNDKIYVIGGHPYGSVKVTIDDVSVYDPATDEWHSKQPMPSSLAWFGTAVYQNKIYVIGGAWGLGGSEKNGVWVYDPVANMWTSKTSMPTARGGIQANVVDGKIYVIGGSAADSVLDVNEVYDPVAETWATKMPIPTPVSAYASAVVDGKIYVIGGLAPNGTSRTRVNLNQIYDPATGTWSLGSPLPNAQKSISAGATIGVMAAKRIYVVGDGLNQIYDPANDSWTVAEPIPDSANRLTNFDDAEIAVVNDQLYALGGVYKDENGNVYSVNEQYTPIGYGTPEQFPQSPSPEPQSEPFPVVPALTASVAALVLVSVAALVYFKKRKR